MRRTGEERGRDVESLKEEVAVLVNDDQAQTSHFVLKDSRVHKKSNTGVSVSMT